MDNKTLERYARQLLRLRHPEGVVDVVLDTDIGCEVDDQYALAYLVSASDRLRIRGIHTAPYIAMVEGREDRETCYHESVQILKLMHREDLIPLIRRGCARYLPSETQAVHAEAVDALIELSQEHDADDPLYVAAIGAPTNIASALILDPTLKERICMLWLGANSFEMPDSLEYNFEQDVAADRVLYASGVPLISFPVYGVTSHLSATKPDLDYWLDGQNALCQYLHDKTIAYIERNTKLAAPSKVIWDVIVVAWLLDETMMRDRIVTTPRPQYDLQLTRMQDGMPMRYIFGVDRNKVFSDLFTRLRTVK